MKHKKIFYWVLLTVAVGFYQTAAAQNRVFYFNNLSGKDNNPGTIRQPWKSIEKLNATALKPGDKILLKGGQTFKGTILLNGSGTAGKLVELASYGSGRAVIDGENGKGILVGNAKFVTVRNLILTGNGRKKGNTDSGITISESSNIQIDGVDVSGFQKAGVRIASSSHIRIINVNAHDNGFGGIEVAGKGAKTDNYDIYIAHCSAENNPGDPTLFTNHSGNGVVVGLCRKVLIEYCVATNNGWDMPRQGNGPVGIWAYEADSVIIQHCLSYRNKTSKGSADGGGFDLDGGVTNSVIQYCLSYENHGSGFGIFQYAGASNWFNNTIRFNISENDGIESAKAGVYVWNSSRDSSQFRDCRFYNNVIYNDRGAAISYSEESERAGFVFYNNIFVAKDQLVTGEDDHDVFLGNNWWSINGGFRFKKETHFKSWLTKTGKEQIKGRTTGFNSDPHFPNPGLCSFTSADHLETFKAYLIPEKSILGTTGLDLKKHFGIDPGKVDFNQKPLPVTAIGASF